MGALDIKRVLADAIVASHYQREDRGVLHASDLGYALGPEHDGCPLQFWLLCQGAPRKEIHPGVMLMQNAGTLMHEHVVRLLEHSLEAHGWEIEGVELPCDHELAGEVVKGTLDILVRQKSTGRREVWDVKTKRGAAFRYLEKEGAKPGNVLQVQNYMMAADADGGGLIYVDREGQNFCRIFPVERDDARPMKAAQTLVELRDGPAPDPLKAKLSRRQNKGPDSLYLENPWQVNWCDMEVCPCAEAIGSLPDGIVAKIKNSGLVVPEEGYEHLLDQVMVLLKEQYPEEEFHTHTEEE